MSETFRTRFRDMGERFERSARNAASAGKAAESRRMFLSAAREYLRVAAFSDASVRDIWIKKADKMESLAKDTLTHERPGARNEPEWTPGTPHSEHPGKRPEKRSELSLDDIAGLADVKQAIMTRIIYPFMHPETSRKFQKNPGGGILMFGPPGTGKTMIAKAVATQIGAGFYSVGCSDIFSKYVGETEKNMRSIFEKAAESERAVLFLDEVEALLGKRGNERSPVLDRLVPEFLGLTDGVDGRKRQLLLLAATNRPWDLDDAALREGRFGQLIFVGLPDQAARKFILERHLTDVPVADDIDTEVFATRLDGYTGADIAGLCREATDYPYLREIETGAEQTLGKQDLERALDIARPSVTEESLNKFHLFARSRGLKM
jgi:transitional endoplasmic reticulum ATPase